MYNVTSAFFKQFLRLVNSFRLSPGAESKATPFPLESSILQIFFGCILITYICNVLNNSVTRDSYFLFGSALPIEASDSILAALDLRLSAAACGRQSGANTGPSLAGRSRRCVRLRRLFVFCCCGLLMSDSDAESQCSRAPAADRAHHCVRAAVALPPAAAHCAAAICRCAYVLKIYNVFV